jgi:hypothetical protein
VTEEFRTSGFVVLHGAFEAGALRGELDLALGGVAPVTTSQARVEYVPMMCARTPVSLSLLDRFEALAESLLGRPVLPLRAKGMRYHGDTNWHRDSELALPSVGVAAYLDPLEEESGALRVVPESHRRRDAGFERACVLATQPGDVLVFDEHLLHSSRGGGVRRQWRVDYFADPRTPAEEGLARELLSRVFPSDWRGGYDAERFPSYGSDWLSSGRRAVERLRQLGAYDLASAQERTR